MMLYARTEEAKKQHREWMAEWRRKNPKQHRENYTKWNHASPERLILVDAKRRAKRNGIPFDLELEDILIPKLCPALGIPLSKTKVLWTGNSPSLDRVNPDPKVGYVKGNVRVVSFRANFLKQNATLNELRMLVKYLEDQEV